MGRQNRYLPSQQLTEICLSVREGLPFPCWALIRLLLQSAMARANRGNRVTICHFVWMGNHLHLLVVVHDPHDCTKFYGELQKNLTDYVKRLLGLKHLDMWEGRPMVAPILDEVMAVKRIVYCYSNPARADLVDTIANYPGLTSWAEFSKASSLNDKFVRDVPWVRCPAIGQLPADVIGQAMDRLLTKELGEKSRVMQELVVAPNAWGKCFGLTDDEVQKLNDGARADIIEAEQQAAFNRKQSGKKVIGADRLRSEQFCKPHTPKKRERRLFCLSSIAELRVKFIRVKQGLSDKCRDLYEARLFHLWPPGMFRPPSPPIASALGWE